jgi:myo-inositol-hexaphosphate 3-phosphohydrolase
MKKLVAIGMVASLCMGMVGCEDGGDTTVNEAPVYQTGTNGHPVVVVNENDGLVVIDLTTGEAIPYDVFVNKNGSNGIISIRTQPYIPPAPEPPEAE